MNIQQTNNFFESKEFRENLELFEKNKKEGKDCILSSDELTDIAEYYYEAGNSLKAKDAADYAVSLYPDAQAPLSFLARYALNLKNDKDGAKQLIGQIAVSDAVDYYSLLAEYYLFDNKPEKAYEALDKAELEIDDEEEMQDYIFDTICLLLDYSKTDEAKKWLDKFKDPESYDAKKMKARLYFESGKYDEGAKIMEELLDNNPFDSNLWGCFANVQMNDDRYEDALASCEYALAINDKDYAAYFTQGMAYFKLGNFEKAIESFNHYAEGNASEQTELMKARCMLCMQEPLKGLLLLGDALAKHPQNEATLFDIYKNIAVAYDWMEDYTKALSTVERMKKLKMAEAEVNLIEGSIMLSQNLFAKANAIFSEGYDKAVDKAEYLFQTAIAYYERGYDIASYLVLKELFENDPDRKNGWSYLAACCLFLGKEEEFLHYLNITLERFPAEAQNVLGNFFPEGMRTDEYLQYATANTTEIINKIKSGKQENY